MTPELEFIYDHEAVDIAQAIAFVQQSYWGEGRRAEDIREAIHNSYCVAGFLNGHQTCFARAVSDRTFFAYIFDLYVLEDFRSRGFGARLLRALLDHPQLARVTSWNLSTRDAQAFYRRFGFRDVEPGRTMRLRREEFMA